MTKLTIPWRRRWLMNWYEFRRWIGRRFKRGADAVYEWIWP